MSARPLRTVWGWATRTAYTLLTLVLFGALTGPGPDQVLAQNTSASPPATSLLTTIGVLSGDAQREFGDIVGMTVDEEREILFTLDAPNRRLSAFGRDGRFIAATGRPGQGPGEFAEPVAVAGDRSGVYVLDARNMRLTSYSLGASGFNLRSEVRIPFHPEAACLLEGRLVLLGYRDGAILHRARVDDATIDVSFGGPFRTGDPLVAAWSTRGFLHCDSADRAIYVAASGTSAVRRYSAEGHLVWEAELPGYVPTTMIRTGEGVVRYEYSGHGVVSLVKAPGGRLIVQYFTRIPADVGSVRDITEVTSVLYDARTGRVLGSTNALPRIDLGTDAFAYSHGNYVFPQVRVYAWR